VRGLINYLNANANVTSQENDVLQAKFHAYKRSLFDRLSVNFFRLATFCFAVPNILGLAIPTEHVKSESDSGTLHIHARGRSDDTLPTRRWLMRRPLVVGRSNV
jgi:hypothetical protein